MEIIDRIFPAKTNSDEITPIMIVDRKSLDVKNDSLRVHGQKLGCHIDEVYQYILERKEKHHMISFVLEEKDNISVDKIKQFMSDDDKLSFIPTKTIFCSVQMYFENDIDDTSGFCFAIRIPGERLIKFYEKVMYWCNTVTIEYKNNELKFIGRGEMCKSSITIKKDYVLRTLNNTSNFYFSADASLIRCPLYCRKNVMVDIYFAHKSLMFIWSERC